MHSFIRKICSVRFFRLQIFVLSAFFYHKSLQCALFHQKDLQCPLFHTINLCTVCIFLSQKVCSVRFFITKVCSVRFFRLQKFVVYALFHYKNLQCPHFSTTKVCSILNFVSVIQFNVLEELTQAKQPSFIISSIEFQP